MPTEILKTKAEIKAVLSTLNFEGLLQMSERQMRAQNKFKDTFEIRKLGNMCVHEFCKCIREEYLGVSVDITRLLQSELVQTIAGNMWSQNKYLEAAQFLHLCWKKLQEE